jgi:hypothetical protein
MKFYRLNEIPKRSDDQMFQASTLGAFIWPIIYFRIRIALLLLGISHAKIYGLNMPSGLFFY